MAMRFWGIICCMIGFLIFMIGEGFYMQYATGVNTSSTNQGGAEAGMAIGGIIYFVGSVLYSMGAHNMMFMITNLVVLGIILLQVAEYYGVSNQNKNDPSVQQGVYAALGIGLILLVIASSMYIVGTASWNQSKFKVSGPNVSDLVNHATGVVQEGAAALS